MKNEAAVFSFEKAAVVLPSPKSVSMDVSGRLGERFYGNIDFLYAASKIAEWVIKNFGPIEDENATFLTVGDLDGGTNVAIIGQFIRLYRHTRNKELVKFVSQVIEHGKKKFGGYDSVVLWLAYPILGIGPRNQTDMYRDMPGSLQGLRDLTEIFHKHGIKVFVPFLPWDGATRKENNTDAEVLLSVVETINADGISIWTPGMNVRRCGSNWTRSGPVWPSTQNCRFQSSM